jgi:hypothetical protein
MDPALGIMSQWSVDGCVKALSDERAFFVGGGFS